jgi:hypothetical protein
LIDQQHALIGGIGPGDASGFPITITQPGAYRLASNLTLQTANTTGIVVLTKDVSIDLNGFSIIGPCAQSSSCAGTTGVGIKAADDDACTSGGPVKNGLQNVSVKNGTIRGTGAGALLLGPSATVDNITVLSTGRFGIATGDFSTITNNRVSDTRPEMNCNLAAGGITPGGGSVASGNTVSRNDIGFYTYFGTGIPFPSTLLIGNTSVGNRVDGLNLDAAVRINNRGLF